MKNISLDDAIDYLNELLDRDRPAIAAMVANRVPCNRGLADHPTVQVMQQHGGYHVGLLGVINGMFGVFNGTDGPIAAVFEDGYLLRFTRREAFSHD